MKRLLPLALLALPVAAETTLKEAVTEIGPDQVFHDDRKDATPFLSNEHFTVGGGWTLGGYYDTYDHEVANYGTTSGYLNVDYYKDGWIGHMQVDAWVNDDFNPTDVDSEISKLSIGYEFDGLTLSYGVEDDTALDHVDGRGDLTYNFGLSALDAGDQFNVLKVRGNHGPLEYGVSHFDMDDDYADDDGYNGYLGLGGVYLGYELRDSDHEVLLAAGNTELGGLDLGATVYRQEVYNYWTDELGDEVNGYMFSVGKQFYSSYLAVGWTGVDGEQAANVSWDTSWRDMYAGLAVSMPLDGEQLVYFDIGKDF